MASAAAAVSHRCSLAQTLTPSNMHVDVADDDDDDDDAVAAAVVSWREGARRGMVVGGLGLPTDRPTDRERGRGGPYGECDRNGSAAAAAAPTTAPLALPAPPSKTVSLHLSSSIHSSQDTCLSLSFSRAHL